MSEALLRYWPLDAPGMPPPGPDFVAAVQARNDDTVFIKKNKKVTFTPGKLLRELYGRALRQPGFTLQVKVREGAPTKTVTFVPGHLWGQNQREWAKAQTNINIKEPPADGPQPARVMVIGKMPWYAETKLLRNFVSDTGAVMVELIASCHIPQADKWYITNLVKFKPPDGTSLKVGWIQDCLPLLHAELRLVRPDYILCIGTDASKALLGNKYTVTYMDGRVVPFSFQVQRGADEQPVLHEALVMTVLHPAEVARSPDKRRILERGMQRFALLLEGKRFDLEEADLDHRVTESLEEAEEWLQEGNAALADVPLRKKLVAWDAEWEGKHPINKGSYVRTIQISWAAKQALCFKICHAGGEVAFRDRNDKPAVSRLAALLNDFMRDKRGVGHFLVSDLEWLHHLGIDPTASCPPPLEDAADGRLAWERLRDGEGWLDTGMMAHAIEETAALGLEMLTARYTTVPRYDVPMAEWKKSYCKELGIKAEALKGYGNAPDELLVPYACFDSDATLRLCRALLPLLDRDYEGNCCWEPCWESMIAQPVILDMHKNGILVDKARIDELTVQFLEAREKQEAEIQTWSNWKDFNIRSTYQVREYLFGEALNGKVPTQNLSKKKKAEEAARTTVQYGRTVVRLRPVGAKSLGIMPLIDTSKPPKLWYDVIASGAVAETNPSTGKMALAIMAQDNLAVADQINWVRYYRYLDQVLKSVLREPQPDDVNPGYAHDDDGFMAYEAGLASCIDDDNRVRTHFNPTTETGRWRSARPPIQNISKTRDEDYERLLGVDLQGRKVYQHKLRSIFKASPGYALIEFDYKGAELYMMAIMAGDQTMIKHCERALLPDEGYDDKGHAVPGGKYPHPDYYDIHSNVAVLAFRLACAPTKHALKSAGLLRFRTLAKNVIFGIAYGRGAKAIALQAKENRKPGDPDITVAQAQAVIDAIFAMYAGLQDFFTAAEEAVRHEHVLVQCFGRLRRFSFTRDHLLAGEFERQGKNFPIQSGVASCVDRGLAWLRHGMYSQGLEKDIRLLSQMHDAGLVECAYSLVAYAAKELIPWAMCTQVPIYPTTLDGMPMGTGPYRLGLDISVEKHWGEKFTLAECQEFGLPTEFAGKG